MIQLARFDEKTEKVYREREGEREGDKDDQRGTGKGIPVDNMAWSSPRDSSFAKSPTQGPRCADPLGTDLSAASLHLGGTSTTAPREGPKASRHAVRVVTGPMMHALDVSVSLHKPCVVRGTCGDGRTRGPPGFESAS